VGGEGGERRYLYLLICVLNMTRGHQTSCVVIASWDFEDCCAWYLICLTVDREEVDREEVDRKEFNLSVPMRYLAEAAFFSSSCCLAL